MKKLYLALLFFFIAASHNLYAQYVFNFSFGPGVSFNRLDPTQLDTFSVSWNDYYKVGLKQGFSLWDKQYAAPGFEIAFDMYNPSRLSAHVSFSVGAYWTKHVNKSILWNNYVHELDFRYNDVPVFIGLGPQFKGLVFVDYLFGGNFREISMRSTVTYPDGSRSMGYEMDILGYYEAGSTKLHHGVGISARLWRFMISARWTFPIQWKNESGSETQLMDFDVNRWRQSEFPVDFRKFSDLSQGLVYDEENMVDEVPLHKSVINVSVKFLIGKIKN
jgi:hypothetical protein